MRPASKPFCDAYLEAFFGEKKKKLHKYFHFIAVLPSIIATHKPFPHLSSVSDITAVITILLKLHF